MGKLRVRDKRGKDKYFVDNALLRGGWGKEIGPYGIAVYNAIAIHADYEDQDAWPSLQLLADLTGMSRPTVIKAVKKLESLRIIEVERRPHKPHTYYLLHKDEWIGVNVVNTRSKPDLPQGVNGVYPNNTHQQNAKNKTHVTPPTAGIDTPTNSRTMFSALASLCKWDIAVITKDQRGRLNQSEKWLRSNGGATVQDVSAFGEWWYKHDWRGKKGEPPLPHLIREQWGRFTASRQEQARHEAESLAALERQREQQRQREQERESRPALAKAQDVWREAQPFFQGSLPKGTYTDYIQPLEVLEPANGTFKLSAPTERVHEWVTVRLMPTVKRAIESVGGPALVEIVKGE